MAFPCHVSHLLHIPIISLGKGGGTDCVKNSYILEMHKNEKVKAHIKIDLIIITFSSAVMSKEIQGTESTGLVFEK